MWGRRSKAMVKKEIDFVWYSLEMIRFWLRIIESSGY
jgi:hypothetical protein